MERLTWGEMVPEEPLIIVDKQKDTIGLANTHSRTILTIARAADILAKAVSFFQELPQTNTLSSSEFIRGAFYHAEFLLRRPLRVLKRDLEHARTTTTTFKQSEHIADGPVTVDSLLDAATDAAKDLFNLLEASCDSKLGSQSKVPVVNPYESLGCVLCEQPEVCRALEDPAYDDKKLLSQPPLPLSLARTPSTIANSLLQRSSNKAGPLRQETYQAAEAYPWMLFQTACQRRSSHACTASAG